MRCDKCWLRWPQANQDKNHRCTSNTTLPSYFIFLSVPACSESGFLWEWKGSILIGLRWPRTGHLTFLLPKSFFSHNDNFFLPGGLNTSGKAFHGQNISNSGTLYQDNIPDAIIEYDSNLRCWRENSLKNYILEFCLKWQPIHGLWMLRL